MSNDAEIAFTHERRIVLDQVQELLLEVAQRQPRAATWANVGDMTYIKVELEEVINRVKQQDEYAEVAE